MKDITSIRSDLNKDFDEGIGKFIASTSTMVEDAVCVCLICRSVKASLPHGKYSEWEAKALERNKISIRTLTACKFIYDHADEARKLAASGGLFNPAGLAKALKSQVVGNGTNKIEKASETQKEPKKISTTTGIQSHTLCSDLDSKGCNIKTIQLKNGERAQDSLQSEIVDLKKDEYKEEIHPKVVQPEEPDVKTKIKELEDELDMVLSENARLESEIYELNTHLKTYNRIKHCEDSELEYLISTIRG
jgi:hypothetical protein